MAKLEDGKTYIVTGCGVSMLCPDQESVLAWVEMILEKGGTPTVSIFNPESITKLKTGELKP